MFFLPLYIAYLISKQSNMDNITNNIYSGVDFRITTRIKTVLLLLSALLLWSATAQAQTTPIKFQLDWRFEGPAALFLTPVAKGYFKDAKLDVIPFPFVQQEVSVLFELIFNSF